jgi:hypothetical protein
LVDFELPMDTAPHIRTAQPAIRMKLGEEMSINRKVLYALGNPQHICFWWSSSRRVLFIGAVTEENPQSLKVSNSYYTSKSGFKLEKVQFLRAVMDIADWNKNMICVVHGEYIADLDMVAFRLDNAEIVEL